MQKTGSCGASRKFFTGKERDGESGLDDFGARYFSSQWGRWMTPDWSQAPTPVPYASLENPQSLNLYAYVGNDPINGQDADGHFRLTGFNSDWATDWTGGDDVGEGGPNPPPKKTSLVDDGNKVQPNNPTNVPDQATPVSKNGKKQQIGQDPTLPTAIAPPPPNVVDSIMNAIFPKTWGDVASLALMVPTDGFAEGAAPLARGLELSMKLTEEGISDAEKVAKITEEADKLYSSKAGKFEAHHDIPQALGGPKSGPTTRLPASYHQMVTNMTRTLTKNYTDFSAGARTIMDKVYSYFPIRW